MHHPVFGMKSRKTPLTNKNQVCDFCIWIAYISKPGVNDDLIQDTKIGNVAVELTCTFDSHDRGQGQALLALVKKAKQVFLSTARKYGEDPHEYVNTPSCDKNQLPFGERYGIKFAVYIYDGPAGNYLSPRGSSSHQDFCKLFCLAFSAVNQ